MKPTKYRIWDKFEKKWKELYHYHLAPNGQLYYGGMNITEHNEIVFSTGLKDKNGIEIYEGDILDCANHWGQAVIEWHNAGFRGKYIDHDDKVCYAMIASAPPEGIEVIGNIYENGELLKGADKHE